MWMLLSLGTQTQCWQITYQNVHTRGWCCSGPRYVFIHLSFSICVQIHKDLWVVPLLTSGTDSALDRWHDRRVRLVLGVRTEQLTNSSFSLREHECATLLPNAVLFPRKHKCTFSCFFSCSNSSWYLQDLRVAFEKYFAVFSNLYYFTFIVCMRAKSLQSWPTLCDFSPN